MATATTARIRRCNRESEFAVAQSPGLLAVRPDAKPAGSDNYTIDSFFDNVAHAQAMLTEKFTILAANRRSEAGETSTPLRIGFDVPVTPTLPSARMIDSEGGLDRTMLITGIAVDLETERNSIETVG